MLLALVVVVLLVLTMGVVVGTTVSTLVTTTVSTGGTRTGPVRAAEAGPVLGAVDVRATTGSALSVALGARDWATGGTGGGVGARRGVGIGSAISIARVAPSATANGEPSSDHRPTVRQSWGVMGGSVPDTPTRHAR